MARLRNASTGGFPDLVYLALLTGCRYGELCRFKVADYNADVGTLSLRVAKGGKVRHVTLTEEASAFVDCLVAGRAPARRRTRLEAEQVRLMREACARAGIAPAPRNGLASTPTKLTSSVSRRYTNWYCGAT